MSQRICFLVGIEQPLYLSPIRIGRFRHFNFPADPHGFQETGELAGFAGVPKLSVHFENPFVPGIGPAVGAA